METNEAKIRFWTEQLEAARIALAVATIRLAQLHNPGQQELDIDGRNNVIQFKLKEEVRDIVA